MKLNKAILSLMLSVLVTSCMPPTHQKNNIKSNTNEPVKNEGYFINIKKDIDHSDIFNNILGNVSLLEKWKYSKIDDVYAVIEKTTRKNIISRSELLLLDREVMQHVKEAKEPIRIRETKKQYDNFRHQLNMLKSRDTNNYIEIKPLDERLK